MEDFSLSLAQGSVLFSDSADWEEAFGPVDVTMCRPSFIPSHVSMASKGTPPEKLAAARVLTLLTSEDAATKDVHKTRTEIVEKRGHEAMLKLLARGAAPLAEITNERERLSIVLAREAAAAAVSNLCAQDDSRARIVEAGGIGVLASLLSEEDASDELLKYACGAVGNLARDNEANQDALREAGAIPRLCALALATGVREEDEDRASLHDPEDDDGLELNASIALRKLAIGHSVNYKLMGEIFSESELKYFLHGQMPDEDSINA